MLGESIKHHVKEEEGTMFPEAEKAHLDWEALAQKARNEKRRSWLRTRKTERDVEGERPDQGVGANHSL